MSGGIRKRDIKLLLVVAGILLAVLAYYLGYKKLEEKTAKVDNENLSLQQQVRRLDDISLKKGEYDKEMASFEQNIKSIMTKYAPDAKEEDVVLYASLLEKTRTLDIEDILISKANLLYSLAISNFGGEDATASGTTQPQPQPAENTSSVDKILGIKTESEVMLPSVSLYATVATYKFTVEYENIKSCFEDVYKHPDCRNISSIALSYDPESGKLVGDMTVNLYYMLGGDKTYKEPDAGVMLHGRDNLFGTIGDGEETEESEEDEEDEE